MGSASFIQSLAGAVYHSVSFSWGPSLVAAARVPDVQALSVSASKSKSENVFFI